MSARRQASDVFVQCLEAEGVRYVFGIPGEETLDLNRSLANSSVSFVPVRHEQGGAYMADMYGRLTGRAGVCLGTLGPGAMNLVTAIGDAFLDRAPVVALTGQADLERMHKESHQFIDLVEHAPAHWNPRKDKRIVVVDSQAAEIDEYFQPEVELVGDIYHVLSRLAEECRDVPHSGGSNRLREVILGRLEAARNDTGFPMQPPRALWEIRQALGREDILISDVGLHKLWIGRMFPAHEPNTVLIANGLAGMGFAVPCAVAAKLVHPGRKAVTVNGDGGILMNCQELETAMRLRTAIVNLVWENGEFGSIAWKQDKRFGHHFGV